eukprot:gene45466-50059_t
MADGGDAGGGKWGRLVGAFASSPSSTPSALHFMFMVHTLTPPRVTPPTPFAWACGACTFDNHAAAAQCE